MPFELIRNDITLMDVDAIVNAANTDLAPGGGVCGAIFKAAGYEKLEKACRKIGYCAVGEAVITSGFDSKAKYIIHTPGPIYGKDPEAEAKQLYGCYINSLSLAKKKGIKSIAFPLISTGIYGYPKSEALSIATKAIKDFLEKSEMTVYLAVYDSESFSKSEELFQRVRSYINENMIPPFENRAKELRLLHEERYSAPSVGNCEDAPKEENDEKADCLPICQSITAASCHYDRVEAQEKTMRSLSDLINERSETFSQMLFRLIDRKGMSDVEVYKRANIDRKLFSKMRKKDYVPKKQTAIALAIALRLNLDQTKDLLSLAGFAFSRSSKFDIIIKYFIENENYDIFEINRTLFAFEQPLLGA